MHGQNHIKYGFLFVIIRTFECLWKWPTETEPVWGVRGAVRADKYCITPAFLLVSNRVASFFFRRWNHNWQHIPEAGMSQSDAVPNCIARPCVKCVWTGNTSGVYLYGSCGRVA